MIVIVRICRRTYKMITMIEKPPPRKSAEEIEKLLAHFKELQRRFWEVHNSQKTQ